MSKENTKIIKSNPEMDRKLLQIKFPKELEKIPVEYLTDEELELKEKVLKTPEEITDEELKKVKELTGRWRKAIQKYDIDEIEEAHEKTVKIIRKSNELIDVLDNATRKLTVRLPFFGEIYEMTFNVKPITDSRAIQALTLELDLFKDYSQRDKQIYVKAQNGQKLSPEEAKIVEHLNDKLQARAEENQDELIKKFLAHQLLFEDDDEDNYEERLKFWEKFPLNQRVAVFMEVEKLLGLTEDDNFELFPVK